MRATTGLIWDKALMSQGDLAATWSTTHEPIAFGIHRKRPSDRATGRGQLAARFRKGSVLRYQRPNGNTRHPHEKPVPLLADLIESSTIRGDLVVDPCAGSGTTGVAAVLEGAAVSSWSTNVSLLSCVCSVCRLLSGSLIR
ncbi:hypothetical protein D3C59_37090 [Streptomyces sp. SHP22-7]|nr:hypothetical protein D3C59_37090 [Streptomyces sp. SHP22-7]